MPRLLSSLCLLSLLACGSDPETPEPDPDPDPDPTTAPTIDGVRIVADGPQGSFALGDLDLNDDGGEIELYGEIVNEGTTWECFVSIRVEVLDAAGSVFGVDDRFVTGSTRALSAVQTHTCLGPGEAGEFWLPTDFPYADLAEVAYSFEWSDSANEAPDTTVVVDGDPAEAAVDADRVDLTATLANTGAEGALFRYNAAEVFVRDDAGHWVSWGIETNVPENTLLPPGQSGDVLVEYLEVPATGGHTVTVYPEWEDPDLVSRSAVQGGDPRALSIALRDATRELLWLEVGR